MPRTPKDVAVSEEGTLRVSDVSAAAVYVPKAGRKGAVGTFSRLGRVHAAVFSPKGSHVVGLLVKRPDIAGMVKREDAFVALDALAPCDGGLMVTRPGDGMDDAARKRLGLDWDACVLWAGMDAKTADGRQLGYVSDAVFDARTGKVSHFCIGDGGVAQSLVGSVEVPASMVQGYRAGYMIVDAEAAGLGLSGGLAAKAGVGYAKAKIAGKEAAARAKAEGAKAAERAKAEGAKVAEAAGDAIDKGSRAVGRQLGKTKGMFGAFMDEYKKASK